MWSKVLDPVRRDLEWLQRSGIQEPAGGPDAGGVWAWIDEATGKPSYLFPEIAGYFMTLCAHLARFDPEGGWIRRAEDAAAWTVERAQLESGAILCRKYLDAAESAADPFSFENRRVPFFDQAMAGFGLILTYEATGNARWLEAARRVGAFCEEAFESPDGKMRYAIFDHRAMRPLDPAPRWSAHFGPFEVKSAMFLDSLARATGETRHRVRLAAILETALASQHPSGRFPTEPDGATTHLHPHCYTLEGLLYLAARQGRRDLLEPVKRGVDWAFRTCLRPAELMQQWSERPEKIIRELRCDTLAQALRAYNVTKLLDPAAEWAWESDLPALYERMSSFALPSGGTSYGVDEYGRKATHANSWGHFFALEMKLFRGLREHALPFEPAALILT